MIGASSCFRRLAVSLMFGIPAITNGAGNKPPSLPDLGHDFLLFFENPSVTENMFTFAPQYDLAREAGLTYFTFDVDNTPWSPQPEAPEWKTDDALLDLYTSQSHSVHLAPRLEIKPPVGQGGITTNSLIVWKDGPSNLVSWADPVVRKAACNFVYSYVQHSEATSTQIWAYHLAARQTGEWIPDEYITHGADYSEPSKRAFQQWLKTKYRNPEALDRAWAQPGVRFENATIPLDETKRFPMAPTPPSEVVQTFYNLPGEQPWVDYSQFVSDLNVGCIKELAAQVKNATARKRAVIVFYGYVFNLPGSICGHLRASELLNDPDVDIIGAPISYSPFSERLAGGVGSAMGAVDSYPLHNKAWVNEDDLATHAQDKAALVPAWYGDNHDPLMSSQRTADLNQTQGVLRRNLAFAAYHHADTWWMDLFGGGWFSDPAIWDVWKGSFGESMRDVRASSSPYRPEVSVIVDEESRFYEKLTLTGFYDIYSNLANAFNGCGTSVGFYYLQDYLDGRVPPSACTVFVNLWKIDGVRGQQLKKRLGGQSGSIVWQYAPGFMNAGDPGSEGVEAMTGFKVTADQGQMGSIGTGPLSGLSFGGDHKMNPRIVIDDPSATPLAHYTGDGSVSAAAKNVKGSEHILVADIGWSSPMVSNLLKFAHVPLISDRPAVVQAKGASAFVFATSAGEHHLHSPDGMVFETGTSESTVNLNRNDSVILAFKDLSKRD
jgi:hypothetical protein